MTPITGAVYERTPVKVRSKSVVMLCDEKGTPTSPRSRGDGGTCRRAGIHRVERGRERRRWVRRSSCRGAVGLERHRQRDDSGLPPDELAKRVGLPADGPGSLMERDQGRYLVDARVADVSPATLAALEAAGAHVVNADAEYLVATLEVAPAQLRAVARVPAVESVEEVLQPIVGGGTGP